MFSLFNFNNYRIIFFNSSIIKFQFNENELWEYEYDYKLQNTIQVIIKLLISYIAVMINNNVCVWGGELKIYNIYFY